MTDSRFGPSAVLTPANLVTIGRLLVTPLLIVMIAVWGSTWAAVVVAFAASVPLTASTVTSQEGKGRRRQAHSSTRSQTRQSWSAPTRCSPRCGDITWWPVGLIAAVSSP